METTKPMKASVAFNHYAQECATKGSTRGIVHANELIKLLEKLVADLGGIPPLELPKDILAVYTTALKADNLFTFSAAGLVRAATAASMAAEANEVRLAASVA